MLGHRGKTADEMRWALIKATVRAKVGLEVAAWRMARTDEILGELWPAFSASLNGEEILDIDPEYASWIKDATEAVGETRSLGV